MRQGILGVTIAAALATGVVLATVLAGCQPQSPVSEPAESWAPTGAGARVPSEGPLFDGEWVSFEEAQRRMPFRIQQPAYVPGEATVSRVQATRSDRLAESQGVALIYSNGLMVTQGVGSPPDAQLFEWVKETPPHMVLDVNGAPAIGHEPGDTQGIGGTVHNPGSVSWWVDGKGYAVIGDMVLKELVRIAESMQ